MQPELHPVSSAAIKIDLPDTLQTQDYTCGAAALLSLCLYYGRGPETEQEVTHDMGFGREGSDPAHVLRAVRKYELQFEEFRPMTIRQLQACLDLKRPVMLMLQAWADPPPDTYRDRWTDGHWVVAIGYDHAGFYFEDPSIQRRRGFLSDAALDERWHDIEGEDNHPVEHYGVAIWKPPLEARRIV